MTSPYGRKAKATKFEGQTYRSRIEAEWAKVLNRYPNIEYEKKTRGVYYLPDFTIGSAVIEVKPMRWNGYPQIPSKWIEKAIACAGNTGNAVLIVFGAPGYRKIECCQVTYGTSGIMLEMLNLSTRQIHQWVQEHML